MSAWPQSDYGLWSVDRGRPTTDRNSARWPYGERAAVGCLRSDFVCSLCPSISVRRGAAQPAHRLRIDRLVARL